MTLPKTLTPARARLSLALLVLLAYANAFSLDLAFDGVRLVADTRTHGTTAGNLDLIFKTPYWWPDTTESEPAYRPLTTISFLANFAFLENGVRPVAYHTTNILLHIGNVWLVFALARRILQSLWPALLAAALWAVHPVGTDVVANVAGRADLLATTAVLAGLWIYLRGPRRNWLWVGGLFLLAATAVFAKESGAVLIGLMLLSDLAPALSKPHSWKIRIAAYTAVTAALALYFAMRLRAFADLPAFVPNFVDNPLRGAAFLPARWSALKILAQDVALLIWPSGLACDRSYNQISIAGWLDPIAWCGLGLAAALAASFVLRHSRPRVFWLAGFFVLTLLPVSNVIVRIGAPMGERFLYVPGMAFAIAVVALVFQSARPGPAAAGITVAVTLLTGRTLLRNADWQDNATLMAHDVKVVPNSFRVHAILGEALYLKEPPNLHEAIRELETAWSILAPLPPERSDVNLPLGLAVYYNIAALQARPDQRLDWQTKAVQVLERAEATARARERLYDEAQARYNRPAPPHRSYPSLYLLLGAGYRALGREQAALHAFEYGRRIDPTVSRLYDGAIGVWLARGNQEMAALTELERTLATDTTLQNLAAIAELYGDLPGGDCAIVQKLGKPALNTDCPRLRDDLCRAIEAVTRNFTLARRLDRAADLASARTRYGCSTR